MLDFTHTVSGGFRFRGCVNPTVQKRYIYKFDIGSIVYPRKLAEKGILSKSAIKKVYIFTSESVCQVLSSSYLPTKCDPIELPGGVGTTFVYQDTLNARYVEGDLLWPDEAQEVAAAYWTRVRNSYLAILRKNGCA
jgi:hypothetical protein